MNPIPGSRIEGLQLPRLSKIRDIQYFEGPLLSEFKDEREDHYLGHWCDCDDTANRWLIVRTPKRDIIRLVNQIDTLRQTLVGGKQDRLYYFIDISADMSVTAVSLATRTVIPDDYLPSTESFISASLMPADEITDHQYSILLDGDWSTEALRDVPKKYENAYSLLYASKTKQATSDLGNFPWIGGFSTVHFYDRMRMRVPLEHRPRIEAIHYASPGYITFRSDRRIGLLVARSIHSYLANSEAADSAYSDTERYIRTHELNGSMMTATYDARKHEPELSKLGEALSRFLEGVDWNWLSQKTGSAFEATKIAMAHFRRLRELALYEKNGLVSFIEPTIPEGAD
ncbi:hypothetical protein [Corallococcus sicarius]|uniref:hypothetical protein n=1 Tax=Corallococcus sicarius TaxID=2316726 RepID=UPI0011C3B93A|nr:hypothetical protein [Corallococcus sicarius]